MSKLIDYKPIEYERKSQEEKHHPSRQRELCHKETTTSGAKGDWGNSMKRIFGEISAPVP